MRILRFHLDSHNRLRYNSFANSVVATIIPQEQGGSSVRRRATGAMLHPDQKATIADLLASWQRALSAENKRKNTLLSYHKSVHAFDQHLLGQGHTRMITDVRRENVQTFISELLATRSANTAATRYTVLKIFFGWCVGEGELRVSPMERMRHPKPPPSPSPVITDEHIHALLKACA